MHAIGIGNRLPVVKSELLADVLGKRAADNRYGYASESVENE
jgi:hypothetical protein